jgi:Flp pilus assembly pilin Flp
MTHVGTRHVARQTSVPACAPRRSRRRTERGASAVEYALLVGLIAVAIIGTVSTLGGRAKTSFHTISNTLPNAAAPNWVWCANEGGSCTMAGTKSVRYGHAATNRWAYQTRTGSFSCTNGVFGDPAFGVGKACFYDSNS